MKLDDLLKEVGPPRKSALDAARAAARAELRAAKPIAPWTTQLARVAGAVLGLVVVAAVVLFAVGQTTVPAISGHALTLALLAGVAIVTAAGALKPSAPRLAALAAAIVGAAAIVALRPEGVGYSPEWVCTLSQVGIGVLPIAVVLLQLRSVAPDPWRALLGGISAGCVGAMLGELACGRGPLHVLAFHLPAWAIVAVATVLISRRVTPRSYAP